MRDAYDSRQFLPVLLVALEATGDVGITDALRAADQRFLGEVVCLVRAVWVRVGDANIEHHVLNGLLRNAFDSRPLLLQFQSTAVLPQDEVDPVVVRVVRVTCMVRVAVRIRARTIAVVALVSE